MSDKIKAKRIIERWNSNIRKEDKKHANMPPLFDAVASELFCAGIDLEIAEEAMREAAKLMYPGSDTIRTFHKANSRGQTLHEFTKSWHDTLDKAATKALYDSYDIDGIDHALIPSVKKNSSRIKPVISAVDNSVDAINKEDFWKSVKIVSKDNPWLFSDEETVDDN